MIGCYTVFLIKTLLIFFNIINVLTKKNSQEGPPPVLHLFEKKKYIPRVFDDNFIQLIDYFGRELYISTLGYYSAKVLPPLLHQLTWGTSADQCVGTTLGSLVLRLSKFRLLLYLLMTWYNCPLHTDYCCRTLQRAEAFQRVTIIVHWYSDSSNIGRTSVWNSHCTFAGTEYWQWFSKSGKIEWL